MLMLMYYWVNWVSQQSLDSLRVGPRLQTLQLRVSPRLQKIPDDQKSFYGCKRKRSSSGLSAEAREKKAKVVFVEDIVCRSDAGLGHNSGSALVDGLSKSTARVKRTLKMKYRIFTLPLAVFIVLSGKYEDDDDNSEEVVYTGHGGNDLLGYKCQMKDQVMCCGNLALKNNMDQDVPVIVICGHKCASSNTLKVYTYDGGALLEYVWFFIQGQKREQFLRLITFRESSIPEFIVLKYHLKQMEEQPILVTYQAYVGNYISGHGMMYNDLEANTLLACSGREWIL